MDTRFLCRGFHALVFLSAFFIFQNSFAASSPALNFESSYTSVAPNSQFEVVVFLDSEASINAFDFKILFSSSTLSYEGFDDTQALTGIWESKPSVSEMGVLTFGGGLFRPFQGTRGELVRLRFRANHDGGAKIFLEEGKVFLADGKGTPADVAASLFSILISTAAPLVSIPEIKDATPPVVEASVVRAPVDDSQLVVFKSGDSESGILNAEFRVMKGFVWSAWRAGENPISIPDGTMIFELKIRNNAGSEEVSRLFLWPEIIKNLGISLAILIAFLLIFIWLYNKKK